MKRGNVTITLNVCSCMMLVELQCIDGGGLTLLPVSNGSWVLRAMKTNKLAYLNGTVCCSLNA